MYAYSNGLFYPLSMKVEYEAAKSWPDTFSEVSNEEFIEFTGNPPPGKIRGTGVDGKPLWIDIPPLTSDDLADIATCKKTELLNEASILITTLQDAVDLDMATEKEAALLLAWKKYRVLLNRINPNDAPDIIWPEVPGDVA
ncbi:tail fiber assembly protein [Enterobacter roggenkampii]|uniref:tail fiber assembly protein n=1 Tax=Enterobacter roggenkampii TaxID=1812935 RepID=UPI000735D917|nr:tail fiber assembly protein [Enterobacter roggenkampii]KTI34166.1 hypothetical protein ASV07_15125 [Enterobacter roggenkampii]